MLSKHAGRISNGNHGDYRCNTKCQEIKENDSEVTNKATCDMGVTPSKQTEDLWAGAEIATYSKGRTGSIGEEMILVE